jgi:hypothetical protein
MRCSAASTLFAPLRPCVPHGLRALTPPALRMSRQLHDGRHRSRLTARMARRIFKISRSCHTARPSHRPMWSASERRSRASFRQLTDSDRLIRSRWLSRRAINAPNTPSALDAKLDAFGAALECRSCIATTNAANRESTLKMGRRIMAERGRKRGKRARNLPRIVRHVATEPVDTRGDDALRAFVRVLARQAARELFEFEARSKTEVLH